METWDAIRARRDVRVLDDRPIAHDSLMRILDAGRRSPSAHNWQPLATIQTMLAAADLGIGAGHAIVEDQRLAADVLAGPIEHPDRRPFGDVVRFVSG